MKKNKPKYYILFALTLLLAVRFYVHFQNNKEDFPGAIRLVEDNSLPKDNNALLIDAKKPLETSSNLCHLTFEPYTKKSFIKKDKSASSRFVNIHKKMDGLIYRLRFFYKETSENEIPQYLLYQEDNQEEEHLIEVSPYKKGPKYQKIEKLSGEVIYTEEGINLGANQDLFFHFENDQLKKVQGNFKNQHYDCTFN